MQKSDVYIEIAGLTKNFPSSGGAQKEKCAVAELNLTIAQGEIFGLLGPNGAGKTTTIRMLTLQTKPSKGSIFFAGQDIHTQSREIKQMIGVVPQHINFDLELTAEENLDLHGRLYHLPKDVRQQRSHELLAFVGLTDAAHYRIRQMSGGMKRRLLIARALIHRPRILFLDEPTVALDPQVRRNIWELIRNLAKEKVTVVLTTHYIEEAENLCRRVAIMDKGKLLATDTPMALRHNLGEFALEWDGDNGREYRFFATLNETKSFAAGLNMPHTIRQTNLEDAFITLTGNRGFV